MSEIERDRDNEELAGISQASEALLSEAMKAMFGAASGEIVARLIGHSKGKNEQIAKVDRQSRD